MLESLSIFGPTLLRGVVIAVLVVVARSKFGIRGLVAAVVGLAVLGVAYAIITTLSLDPGRVHDFERNWLHAAILHLVPTVACGFLVYRLRAIGVPVGVIVAAGSVTYLVAAYATVLVGFVLMIVF